MPCSNSQQAERREGALPRKQRGSALRLVEGRTRAWLAGACIRRGDAAPRSSGAAGLCLGGSPALGAKLFRKRRPTIHGSVTFLVVAQRRQLTVQQLLVAQVELDQAAQMAGRLEVDMLADETDQLARLMGHRHLHAHLGVIGQAYPRLERLRCIGIPLFRPAHQQPLERQIVQFYGPVALALDQFGGGVEFDTLETSTLAGDITHQKSLRRTWVHYRTACTAGPSQPSTHTCAIASVSLTE